MEQNVYKNGFAFNFKSLSKLDRAVECTQTNVTEQKLYKCQKCPLQNVVDDFMKRVMGTTTQHKWIALPDASFVVRTHKQADANVWSQH